MVIDEGAESVTGGSPGSFMLLNIDTGLLFLGGTPLLVPPSNLIRFRTTGEEVNTHTHPHTKFKISRAKFYSLSRVCVSVVV